MPDKISFSSFVVKGEGIGRKIGFGTINLAIPEKFPLLYGVYGCTAEFKNKKWRAALYYGPKTFGDNGGITLEAHLFIDNPIDREYINSIGKGCEMRVQTDVFVRKPQTFHTLKELTESIEKDVQLLTKMYGKNSG